MVGGADHKEIVASNVALCCQSFRREPGVGSVGPCWDAGMPCLHVFQNVPLMKVW